MGEESESCARERNSMEEREVMETPDRSKSDQIAASSSKFEDSPVFNFLNNLSPIKPIKSIHITQTINPLTFASLPSVFTSPHVSSLKESRFLQRQHLLDPSRPEFSSDEMISVDTNKANADPPEELDEQKENLDPIRASSGPIAEDDASQRVLSQIDQTKEATPSDWENLISDGSDLFVFESPNDANCYEKSVDPSIRFYRSIKNAIQNANSLGVERTDMKEYAEADDIAVGPSTTDPREKMDDEHPSGLYRGMRRRCLVFEGARRKQYLEDNSCLDSPMLLQQSNVNNSSNHQHIVPITKTGVNNDSSCRVLPGIGLHLNALASTSSRRLLVGPTSFVDMHPPAATSGQESLNLSNNNNNAMGDYSFERENDMVECSVLDHFQESGYTGNEDVNQSSSPKKKRRQVGDGEGSCKRCNCKKSKCLKLYCECFAAGVYCVEPCACIDCFNKPIHEDTVLATRKQIESRNPLAFAPKVIKGSDSQPDIGDDSSKTPASARHKRGCNCKKSGCLKKYCECYQGGVGCSINCRCEGCKNAFGRKDGSVVLGTDHELEEDENDTNEKAGRSFRKTSIQDEIEQSMDTAPPSTPTGARRQLVVNQPFSSKKKPARSSFPSISAFSSSGQEFETSSFFPPPPKFSRHFATIKEDEEMPEFLLGGESSSPIGTIKTSSPNRKRVFSPPQRLGVPNSSGGGLRSSRKLILQSIPPFPSLAPNQ